MADIKLGTGIVTGVVKKAYDSWRGQVERCTNPKNKAFKHYGAKGIKVAYSSRDFVNWWLKEAVKFPEGTKLTVNRIKTHLGYSFTNIELMAWKDNVSEANARTKIKPVKSICLTTGKTLKVFKSRSLAAKHYKVSIGYVCRHCDKKMLVSRKSPGVSFRNV